MTRKTIGRNPGNHGEINTGSELEMVEAKIGDDVDDTIDDSKEVANALIDNNETDRFLMIAPQ